MDSYPFLLRRDKVIVVIKIGLWATAQPSILPTHNLALH